jgi:hypothetical protein
VGIICSADEERNQAQRELEALGIDARPIVLADPKDPKDPKARVEPCDVVVIFVDGFDDANILERLSALADWPTWIAVTERVPPLSFSRMARARPAVIVGHAKWLALVLATMGVCAPSETAEVPYVEPSGPELPFTD